MTARRTDGSILPFGQHAHSMSAAGFAVLPARGKRPMVAGFNNWHRAPSSQIIDKWVAANGDADIAYVPGLSGARGRTRGLVVVDADSKEAAAEIISIVGDTPGRVMTRRGMHLLFAAPISELVDCLGPTGGSLKRFGFEVDIKYGASIVIAPPSRHQLDPDFHYRWLDCDEAVLGELPVFNPARLRALLTNDRGTSVVDGNSPARSNFRMGSRGLKLNDELVRVIHFFEDVDEALDYAHTFNSQFEELGLAPLDDKEVVARTMQVWADRDHLERRIGLRATATTDAEEIRSIVAKYPNGADVLTLVQLLRAEHGARAARGEGFYLSISSMVERRSLGGWSARRYRQARNAAIDAGLIMIREEGSPGRLALYALVNRKLHPARRPGRRTS